MTLFDGTGGEADDFAETVIPELFPEIEELWIGSIEKAAARSRFREESEYEDTLKVRLHIPLTYSSRPALTYQRE